MAKGSDLHQASGDGRASCISVTADLQGTKAPSSKTRAEARLGGWHSDARAKFLLFLTTVEMPASKEKLDAE